MAMLPSLNVLEREIAHTDIAPAIISAIEAEIDMFYIKKPLDANGVPVSFGDIMEYEDTECCGPASTHRFKVGAISQTGLICQFGYDMRALWEFASNCTHFEEETVEKLLSDFAHELQNRFNGYRVERDCTLEEYNQDCEHLVAEYSEAIKRVKS